MKFEPHQQYLRHDQAARLRGFRHKHDEDSQHVEIDLPKGCHRDAKGYEEHRGYEAARGGLQPRQEEPQHGYHGREGLQSTTAASSGSGGLQAWHGPAKAEGHLSKQKGPAPEAYHQAGEEGV